MFLYLNHLFLAIQSGVPAHLPSFPTGGDMLDFLVQSSDISKPDGLLATWFHRANSKEEMDKALASKNISSYSSSFVCHWSHKIHILYKK